jgi:hypothetical protein
MKKRAGQAQATDGKANNPYKRMHGIIFVVVSSCLTVQVLEGSFIVPYILIHFGYPDLTLKEICDEMYFIVYKDENRECHYPYPLFSEVEPWKYKDMRDVVGHPVPPRPYYEGFGFREVVKLRKEREARKAAENEDAASNGHSDKSNDHALDDRSAVKENNNKSHETTLDVASISLSGIRIDEFMYFSAENSHGN